jgi:type IV pilus assembly protein PilM
MYCYIGGGTNLAIAVGTNCVFNRVLPNGAESMAAALAERKGLTLSHARQWLRHVGLERDLDTIEGEGEIVAEARTVLEHGAARIAEDVRLSLEYYQAALGDARRVERMVMAGPGIALEGLPRVVEAQLGLPVVPRSLGNIQTTPGALDGVDVSELTVAAGLALDEVTA